ncbi:alpha/beta fold hydrolase [Pseudarthrobacter sp. NPDC055928]|uniref:alpha/beta fold hydrolase n=1 Tax=Pseudarthrobacter sp. NPDC055928 TaxID=3345661 RepID=UPI0035E1BDA4
MHVFESGGTRLVATVSGEASSPLPPVLLIAGWPQSRLAWRRVIPPLVNAGRLVYALDPRGFGDSSTPSSGYDLSTVAGEIAEFIDSLGLTNRVELVGHDVGSWISHAVAVLTPDRIRSLALIDAAIPGVMAEPNGYPNDATNIRAWHFGLNRLPELPEILMSGHEREYLEWSFRHKSTVPGSIEPEALDEYVRLFSDPARKHAGFEYYREVFSDTGRVEALRRGSLPITVPMLTVGAAHSVGSLMYDTFTSLAADLEGIVLDCGHYVPEERPRELVEALLSFWSRETKER